MPAPLSPLPGVLVALLLPHPQGLRAVDLWRSLEPRPCYATVQYHLARLCRARRVRRVRRGRYAVCAPARRQAPPLPPGGASGMGSPRRGDPWHEQGTP